MKKGPFHSPSGRFSSECCAKNTHALSGQTDADANRVAFHIHFDGWKKALEGHANATLKFYPSLNHLFIAGTGPSSPGEYARPGHVSSEVVQDIVAWVTAGEKPAK